MLPLAAFFLAAAVLVMWPLVGHMDTHIFGILRNSGMQNSDLQATVFMYWQWKQFALQQWAAMQAGTSLGEAVGNLLAYAVPSKTYYFLNFLILGALELVFGWPTAYNLSVLLAFWLNGLGFGVLALWLYRDRMIAGALGMMFMLAVPLYSSFIYGMHEQIWLFPVPLFVRSMLQTVEEEDGRWRHAVLAGVWLATAMLFYFFYGVFCALLGLVYCAWVAVFRPAWRGRLAMGGVTALVAVNLVLPFLYPFAVAQPQMVAIAKVDQSLDIPSDPSLLDGDRTVLVRRGSPLDYPLAPRGVPHAPSYVPLAVTACALASLVFLRTVPAWWYVVFALFYVLSLGPYVKLGDDEVLGVSWVYQWFVRHVPLFAAYRWPFRIGVFAGLALLVLAGYALARTRGLMGERHRVASALLPVLVAGMGLLQLADVGVLPVQMSDARVPRVYLGLAGTAPQALAIDLPFTNLEAVRQMDLEEENVRIASLYEASHRLSVNYYRTGYYATQDFDGLRARTDPICREITINTFLKQLAYLSFNQKPRGLAHYDDYLRLRKQNYQYLVLHADMYMFTSVELRKWLDRLLGPPVGEGTESFFVSRQDHHFAYNEQQCRFYVYRLPETLDPRAASACGIEGVPLTAR